MIKEIVNVKDKTKTTYYRTILVNQALAGIFIGMGIYTKVPIWYVVAFAFMGFGLIRYFFLKIILKR